MRIPDRIKGHPFPYGSMYPGRIYSWAIGTDSSYADGYGPTPTLGRLYAYPVRIPHPVKIDRIMVNLFAGTAGGLGRIGIYEQKHDGTIFPGDLVADGQIDCSSSGEKYISLSPAKRLYPGIYWLATIFNNVSIEPWTVLAGGHFFGSHGIEGYGGGDYPNFIQGVQADSQTFGALPSTFPAISDWISGGTGNSAFGFWIGFRILPDPDFIYPWNNITFSLFPGSSSEVRLGEEGYLGGGESPYTTEIDGMDFPSETGINPSATLATQRSYGAGIHSSTKGYFCGGYYSTSYYSQIDGIQFSDETAIDPSATLAVARAGLCGINASGYGYCMGGHGSVAGAWTEIDGLRYSDETAVNPSAVLAQKRDDGASYGSSARGYFAGGRNDSYVQQDDIFYFQYSDETSGTLTALCVLARSYFDGVNSTTKGYAGGGHDGTSYSYEIDGLQFSDETQVNPSATLSDTARVGLAGLTSSGNGKGYWCGGYYGASPWYYNVIDGIKFSDETAVNPAGTISTARAYLAGVYEGGAL